MAKFSKISWILWIFHWPGTTAHPRPSSPQITAAAREPFFSVEDVYVPHQSSNDSRSDAFDDPDVWRPPSRVEIPSQYGRRRPTRAGQLAAAVQAKRMASYARGAGGEKPATAPTLGRGNKVTPGPAKTGIGAATAGKSTSVTGNTGPRKPSNTRSVPNKRESMVSLDLGLGFSVNSDLTITPLIMYLFSVNFRGWEFIELQAVESRGVKFIQNE